MAKKLVSKPSTSVFSVNAPEVKDFSCTFIYNYYEEDERITENASKDKMNGEYSRYVRLSWKKPAIPSQRTGTSKQGFKPSTIRQAASKIISEDNSVFNDAYITHTFSDISAVETGLTSFKSFSRINGTSLNSVSRMKSEALKSVYSTAINPNITGDNDEEQQNARPNVSLTSLQMYENYLSAIATSLPTTALGLRVFNNSGELLSDEGEFFKTLTKDVSLPMKIRTSILPDIFSSGVVRKDSTFRNLNLQYEKAKKTNDARDEQKIYIDPIAISNLTDVALLAADPQVRLIGYIIDKYLVTDQGFIKKDSIYIESIDTKEYVDTKVAYGQIYIYNIKSVVSVKVIAESGNNNFKSAICYVSSRAEPSSVKCFEYKPPPPPEDIKFHFDTMARRLMITWDVPVNHQRDIKQFQVFRRRSVGHPFELIKIISFDNSAPGYPDNMKYMTGEIADGNRPLSEVPAEFRDHVQSLIIDKTTMTSRYNKFMYKDNDFTVDKDYTFSDDFIYALASVDAHGMISNYSEQYRVKMNTTVKRLSVDRMSDAGAPRQYPNMMMLTDTFKDAFVLSGSDMRKLTMFFTPEYLKVKTNNGSSTLTVVQSFNRNDKKSARPFYVLQFINLDNQRTQEIKISIKE